VAKRAKIYAEEELRKATAAIKEDRITFGEFEPWFSTHESELYEGHRPVQLFSADIRSAIMHFKESDEELAGELPPQEFRQMCETMGWAADDIEDSVEMMQRTEDGRISLTHFVSWYTDDVSTQAISRRLRCLEHLL
jgi:hypothetical protein